MNFAKAKTILICIFIFVNIFLLVIYNLFFQTEKSIKPSVAVEVLKNNNIKIEESMIKVSEEALNGVEIENFAVNEGKLAKLFLGDKFNNPKNHYYTTEGETLTISDLSVDYKILEPKDKAYKDISTLSAGNKTLKTLVKKGFDKSVLEVSNVSFAGNSSYFITLSYRYNDYPIFNNHLYATVTNKGISTVKGTVISFKELKNVKYAITPASNILLELPLNNDLKNEFKNPTVTAIRLGYYLPMGKTEASIYAIPAYEIEIDRKKIYYYDARENISSDVILLGSRNILI